MNLTRNNTMIYLMVVFTSIFCLHSKSAAMIESVPEELTTVFEQLLSLADPSGPKAPDAQSMDRIIGFLNRAKNPDSTFSMGERDGATSNYSEFRLNRSLKEVLDLVYNPDIPSYLTTPASVRRSKWIQINGEKKDPPKLSDFLDKLTEPVMFTGVEFVENTPDTFSGAYYAYELDRALLLTRHKGRNVLISISRQRDKSDVGKKGLVLGDDDNWNYLYTGEKGCTKSGLGWVKSYMYDSASITVYYEVDDPTPQVHCGVFKWIRAGWAGINMVQPHHIRNGVKRFSKTFKSLIESPALADTTGFSKALRRINDLPVEALRQRVKQHYIRLKSIHEKKNKLVQEWFNHFPGKNGHLAKMTPEEMKAVLEKAYLKKVIGKTPVADAGKKTGKNRTRNRSI